MDFEETLEYLQRLDNKLIFKDMDDSLEKVFSLVKVCSIPKTLEALLMLQCSINFLKTGIFDVAKSENSYALPVLLRSLYEHFIRHLYLFTGYINKKNDDPGIDFYKWTDIKEYRQYQESLKKKKRLTNDLEEIASIDEMLENIYSGYAEMSKKDKNNRIASFSFYNMLHTIMTERLKNAGIMSVFNNFPEDYHYLSSFVHGGPHANKMLIINSVNENNRFETLTSGIKNAFYYSSFSLMNTIIVAGQFEKSLLKYVPKIREAIDAIPD